MPALTCRGTQGAHLSARAALERTRCVSGTTAEGRSGFPDLTPSSPELPSQAAHRLQHGKQGWGETRMLGLSPSGTITCEQGFMQLWEALGCSSQALWPLPCAQQPAHCCLQLCSLGCPFRRLFPTCSSVPSAPLAEFPSRLVPAVPFPGGRSLPGGQKGHGCWLESEGGAGGPSWRRRR